VFGEESMAEGKKKEESIKETSNAKQAKKMAWKHPAYSWN
jgi:hypothetical protein